MASTEVVIGGYKLVKQLACGNFGCVYRGEHMFFPDDVVAIKVLKAHWDSQKDRDDFIQEACLLKQFNHPHILPILGAGEHEGSLYLVLEYAPNGSLKDRLNREQGRPLPVDEAVSMLLQIGDALHYAHEEFAREQGIAQGIVHRDLKPDNILFNAKGEVLVADFGIAVMLEGTQLVDGRGTIAYMAPEQFQKIVSKKSDQYALGCIAYELFTGQRPFVAFDERNQIPPTQHNPHLPVYIEQAILKAMAKKREDRHKDVDAFMKALQKSKEQWLDEGNTYIGSKRYEEALAAFEQALLLDANFALAYRGKGVALFYRKSYEEALAALEQAILLDANFALAYRGKGSALHNLKRYEEALAAYDRAIQLDPNDASTYHSKGWVLHNLKRYEDALAAYDRAIELDPNDANAYNNKGVALCSLQRYEEALAAYDHIIQLDPNRPNACYGNGWTLYKLERYEEALVACERAIQLNPNHADAYNVKGWALKQLGRSKEAQQAYEKARQLG